jgi:hypothetical protein
MRSLPVICGAVALLSLSSVAGAQQGSLNRLIGWATTPTPKSSGQIEIQDHLNKCQPAQLHCPKILVNEGSGGAAYDPIKQSLWVTNGSLLEEYPLASKCTPSCRSKTSPMGKGAKVTGLTIDFENRVLYHLETTPGSFGILPYDIKSCPPVPLKGGCTVKLSNPRATAGGIAYNKVNGLFYVAVSEPAFVGYISTIYVVTKSGCQVICNYGLSTCDVRTQAPISGLAWDHCSATLFATDGVNTRAIKPLDPRKCQVTVGVCCAKGGTTRWQGLAILPGTTGKVVGTGCTGKGCAFCTQQVLMPAGGDAVLGNQGFYLAWRGAPISAAGVLFAGPGLCTKGLKFPFLCGSFYPSLNPGFMVLGSAVLNGRTQCTGAANFPLPLPRDPAFCNISICVQGLVICGTAAGYGLSPALELTLMKD